MTPAAEPWQRLSEIFHRILAAPAAQRDELLAEACAGQPELRAEVEALLAAHEQAGDFLEAGIVAIAPELAEIPLAAEGMRIGPYRVLRELGRGGMGAVYLASRDDATYQQQVAIKLIKRGMDTEEILRRFLAERQILANLIHPNIARLLDGGSTADGRPYFVMEYIDGRPIDAHCADRGLGLEERLRLLLPVAEAVHLAHQHLVVHRDLKPANILVAADGLPRLLDFGIAKVLAQAEGETAATLADNRPRTPDYASPEQIEGGAITTATDVYGLGLLLYQLLTGENPLLMARASGAGGLALPSVRVRSSSFGVGRLSGSRLARHLRGDLDTIVAKALARAPGQRYASARDLADDLERFLARRPVLARRPTLAYQAYAFMRRHKLASAAALGLAALGLTATVLAVALTRERVHVESQRQRAEALSSFLIGQFKVADPGSSRGATVTVRELLDASAHQLMDPHPSTNEGPAGPPRWALGVSPALGREPETRARLLTAVGEVYQNLGLYAEAGAALDRAVTLMPGPGLALERAQTELLLAAVRREQGDLDGSERLLERALAVRRRRLGEGSLAVAECWSELGLLAQLRKDFSAGEQHLRRAIDLQRRAGEAGELDLAESLSNLATLEIDRERPAAAEALVAETRGIHQRLLGGDHPRTAVDLANLAGLLFRKGDFAQAERFTREALELRRRLLPNDHSELAESYLSLSTVARRRGDLATAESAAREAVAICRRLGWADHPLTPEVLTNLGVILTDRAAFDEAERAFVEARSIYQQSPGTPPTKIANLLNNLAQARRDRGDLAGAEQLLSQALALWESALGPESLGTASSLNSLGGVLARQGRYAEAEQAYRRALELRRKLLPPEHPDLAPSLVGLGSVLVERHQAAAAEPLLVAGLELRRRALPAGHAAIGIAERALGSCYAALGRLEQARSLLTSSTAILRATRGNDHPDTRLAAERLAALDRPAE